MDVVVPLFSTFKILTIKNQWLFPSISQLKKCTISINKGNFYYYYFKVTSVLWMFFSGVEVSAFHTACCKQMGWKILEISGLHSYTFLLFP